jgi:hypothetical protein
VSLNVHADGILKENQNSDLIEEEIQLVAKERGEDRTISASAQGSGRQEI